MDHSQKSFHDRIARLEKSHATRSQTTAPMPIPADMKDALRAPRHVERGGGGTGFPMRSPLMILVFVGLTLSVGLGLFADSIIGETVAHNERAAQAPKRFLDTEAAQRDGFTMVDGKVTRNDGRTELSWSERVQQNQIQKYVNEHGPDTDLAAKYEAKRQRLQEISDRMP